MHGGDGGGKLYFLLLKFIKRKKAHFWAKCLNSFCRRLYAIDFGITVIQIPTNKGAGYCRTTFAPFTFNIWSLQNRLIEVTEKRDLNESPVLDSLFKNHNYIVILLCSDTLTIQVKF